ncbi:hypothetical protein D3C85_1629730 [compost metagenome]
MHDQIAAGTGGFKDAGGIVGRSIGAIQGPFAAGEVIVLDVDDDQCLFAHLKSLMLGSGCGVVIVIGLSDALADWRERQIGGKN